MARKWTVFAAMLGALLLAGCDSSSLPLPLASFEVIAPAEIGTVQTPDSVARMMLAQIAKNEEKVGRVLAPRRIVRVVLMKPGDSVPIRHLDGTPTAFAAGPAADTQWFVEAVGTFGGGWVRSDRDARGMHGWMTFLDRSGEATERGMLRCIEDLPRHPEATEGSC